MVKYIAAESAEAISELMTIHQPPDSPHAAGIQRTCLGKYMGRKEWMRRRLDVVMNKVANTLRSRQDFSLIPVVVKAQKA
jgi:hypothetical protein